MDRCGAETQGYTPMENKLRACSSSIDEASLAQELPLTYLLNLIVITLTIGWGCTGVDNRPPQLFGLEDQLLMANQNFQLEVTAFDEDEDYLSYQFELDPPPPTETQGRGGLPEIQKVSEYKAIFIWTPGNADVGQYALTLTVRDDQGGQGSETINLNVVERGSDSDQAIRFLKPVGEVAILNLDETPCLEEDVVIQADLLSDQELNVILIDAPMEASLTPAGAKRYRLSWCPSPTQMTSQTVYPFLIRATNSRGLPNADKQYKVRLRRGSDTPCPGDPPIINHTQIMDQRGVANYEIRVQVSDDIGIKSAPTLSYQIYPLSVQTSTPDPNNWISMEMRSEGNGSWLGYILPAQNMMGVQVFYRIFVSDNDDAEGDCDHEVETPTYSFSAYWDPSIPSNLPPCTPCISDVQCGSAGDLCNTELSGTSVGAGGRGGFCGQSCSTDDSCPEGSRCSPVMGLDTGVTLNQCVSINSCGETCSVDSYDQAAPNDRQENASEIEPGIYEELSICGVDEDFYLISLSAGDALSARIDFQYAAGDLDLELEVFGAEGGQLTRSSTNENFEFINLPCVPSAGSAYLRVLGFDGSDNQYTLTVARNTGQCDTTCTPDSYEGSLGNDTAASATASMLNDLIQARLCNGDIDFYALELQAGEQLEVRIEFSTAEGSLRLSAYDLDFQEIQSASGSGRGVEVFQFTASAQGQYFLKVDSDTSNIPTSYTLSTSSQSGGCNATLECQQGDYCNDSQACVTASCSDQCDQEHACVSQRAGLAPSNNMGTCASRCVGDFDCRTQERCKSFENYTNHCALAGTIDVGGRCSTYADCAEGMVCFPTIGGYCAEGGCFSNLDCPLGTVCGDLPGGSACLKSCDGVIPCDRSDHFCESFDSGMGCAP
jgi:hypothetical protein